MYLLVRMEVTEDVSDPRAWYRLDSAATYKMEMCVIIFLVYIFALPNYIAKSGTTSPNSHRPSHPSVHRNCPSPRSSLGPWQTIHQPLWGYASDRSPVRGRTSSEYAVAHVEPHRSSQSDRST